MKHIIFLFILISFAMDMYGQADTVFMKYDSDQYDDSIIYETDTVIFYTPRERHILIGTTIIPYTHNQINARGYGLYLEKVTKTDCKKDLANSRITYKNKINSVFRNDSILIVETQIFDNCCYSFLCDVSLDSSAILNLLFQGYGTYCSCDCCFGLTYQFRIEIQPEYEKIKAIMINGNLKTVRGIKK